MSPELAPHLSVRHAEAFADEEHAPLISALWAALVVLLVLAVWLGA